MSAFIDRQRVAKGDTCTLAYLRENIRKETANSPPPEPAPLERPLLLRTSLALSPPHTSPFVCRRSDPIASIYMQICALLAFILSPPHKTLRSSRRDGRKQAPKFAAPLCRPK